MLKVPYEQDAYSVIGKYIRDHITAIEDIIAVIKIDNITTNQLFMVDMNEENYFIWNNDWYEGEKDVALIDFFPVSEAINPSAQSERKKGKWICDGDCYICNQCKSAFTWWADIQTSNFCPNCGVDMRKDGNAPTVESQKRNDFLISRQDTD